MPRVINTTTFAELTKENPKTVELLYFDFESGPVYLNTGDKDIYYGGNTYLAAGHVGTISDIRDSAELRVHTVDFQLSGIPNSLVSTALNEHLQGRTVEIYIVFLDPDDQIIGDPIGPTYFRMDTPNLSMHEFSTITLSARSILADWERAMIRRYTDADQQAEFPGDTFFGGVNQMINHEFEWGKES